MLPLPGQGRVHVPELACPVLEGKDEKVDAPALGCAALCGLPSGNKGCSGFPPPSANVRGLGEHCRPLPFQLQCAFVKHMRLTRSLCVARSIRYTKAYCRACALESSMCSNRRASMV